MKRPTKKLPSPEEMAAFDAATIASGVPALELMERAGRAMLESAKRSYPEQFKAESKIVILCGPGNNGGDGLVIARLLHRERIVPQVVVVAAKKYSEEFAAQAKLYSRETGALQIFPAPDQPLPGIESLPISKEGVARHCGDAAIIFDALLGTGQRSAPRGATAELISIVNNSFETFAKRPIMIAVDVPTGIDTDTGAVFEPHLRADRTLTVELKKRGMAQSPAFENCGAVDVLNIGIATEGSCEYELIDSDTAPRFPNRPRDTHKGNAGRVLVVGGSVAMQGAPVLSGFAALRLGAGLVTIIRFEGVAPSVARPPELIDLPLSLASGQKGLAESNLPEIDDAFEAADVIIFGPGIGREKNAAAFTKAFVKKILQSKKQAVIDADALINISTLGALRLADHVVITPHPGEAAKLLGTEIAQIQSNRYAAARSLHEMTGAIAVLKGASTIVRAAEKGFVNSSGNPWMATAGSGDVLCGVIAALMAQGLKPLEAATLAVYVHGCAGDAAHSVRHGPIVASDITAALAGVAGTLTQ